MSRKPIRHDWVRVELEKKHIYTISNIYSQKWIVMTMVDSMNNLLVVNGRVSYIGKKKVEICTLCRPGLEPDWKDLAYLIVERILIVIGNECVHTQ